MVMWYINWALRFPTSVSNTLWQAGYVPHITWEPWTNASMTSITHAMILAGQLDAYIDQFGRDPYFLTSGPNLASAHTRFQAR
jgi:hypothetical protein